MLDAIDFAGLMPEGYGEADEFEDGGSDHNVIEVPPRQMCLRDHTCSDERSQQCSDAVAGVHAALHCVGVMHDADPGAKACIGKPVAEARYGVDNNEGGEGWVRGEYCISGDMAERCSDGNAALAEFGVDASVGEGRDRVASEGSQEDE